VSAANDEMQADRLTTALRKGTTEAFATDDGELQLGSRFVWKKKIECELQGGAKTKDIYEREKKNTEAERRVRFLSCAAHYNAGGSAVASLPTGHQLQPRPDKSLKSKISIPGVQFPALRAKLLSSDASFHTKQQKAILLPSPLSTTRFRLTTTEEGTFLKSDHSFLWQPDDQIGLKALSANIRATVTICSESSCEGGELC